MKVNLKDIVYKTDNSFVELTIDSVDGAVMVAPGYIGENLYGDAMFFEEVDKEKLNEPGKNVMVSDFSKNSTNKIYIDIDTNRSTKNIIKESCSLLNTMAIFERENTL
jgi:hypothetical protein